MVSLTFKRKSNNKMVVRLRVWKIAFSIEYPTTGGSPTV